MQTPIRLLLSPLVALIMLPSLLFAADKPVRGEDLVHAPAEQPGLSVHQLFQTNMVIQRDKPIKVWGWADANEAVSVTFADKTATATANADRKWQVTLPAQAANTTPSELTVKGKTKTIILKNVLIGDVWVLSGQSNMEHPLARVEDGDLEIASANHYPNIRILTVPQMNGAEARNNFARLHEWSGWFNTHFRKGDWDVSSPEVVRDLSAIGYVFARRLQSISQIPIGVIDVSRGGTTVETWTPNAVLREIDTPEVKTLLETWDKKVADFDPEADFKNQIDRHNKWVENQKKAGKAIPPHKKAPTEPRPGPAFDMNRPGNCYASMLSPIAGFGVKGVIWHQGYNNALQENGHVAYGQIFPKMIAAWRAAFNDPQMPFGIISLCTAGPPQNMENYSEKMVDEGIFIRAVQYQTYLDFVKAGDKNIGFASSYDMRRSWYHPQLKVPVGERIARWALATQYGQSIDWKPPTVVEVTPENDRILVKMDMRVQGLRDWPIQGFAISGEDRIYHPAEAKPAMVGKDSKNRPQYDNAIIELRSPHVPKPIHFRYAWGRNPVANVRGQQKAGRAPLPTQRSDNWKLTEAPVVEIKPEDSQRTKNHKIKAAMRKADDTRRRNNAKALLAKPEK